jgi:hypothetical protein
MKIIIDSREKRPWNFDFFGVESVRGALRTGDYTLEGYEKIISIERKKTTGEIATNLGARWENFHKEFIRMKDITYKYLVCEFPASDLDIFPINSGIPEFKIKKLKISANYLKKKLYSYAEEYDINLIFCNNVAEAEQEVFNVFQAIYNKYPRS